ncbi:hypothetical protein Tco_0404347 [Tanacetum coccineum]
MNGWIKADVPLLGELGEIGEPLGAEMVAPVVDMEEDLPILFGDDDDSSDDDSEGLEDDEEVGGQSTTAAEGHSLTLLASGVLVPQSVIEDLYTCMHNLEYGHGLLVKKVITVSDDEVADSITIREIGPRVSAVEGQVTVQHRDVQIQQLQTLVAEMSSREGTLMQCILGMDRRFADLGRRPSGP